MAAEVKRVPQRAARVVLTVAGVAAVTLILHFLLNQNATTAGFAYLLAVLVIAGSWGFIEALAASIAATVAFNYFFLPPIGTLNIADPKNWMALVSFLTASLIGGRLSARAEARTAEALERQHDLERLYTFSRAILLIGPGEPFPKQLAAGLASAFDFSAAVLYERQRDMMHRAGPHDFEGMEEQLREAAVHGASWSDRNGTRVITSVRLGSEPIASLGLQGSRMNDTVLQGIANLVAIGLERAKAQEMAHQIEAARQSEHLRTTLIDAMAHEFKTPLTSIKAATTTLLADSDQSPAIRAELLRVADEEADRLRILIDDSIEMARLDTARIDIQPERVLVREVIDDVLASMLPAIADRTIGILPGGNQVCAALDRRLVRLALKQLIDNALRYSPPASAISIRVGSTNDAVSIEVTDRGSGIPASEQAHIFDRFYRSPGLRDQIPGTGLGLSIARSIMNAHKGELTVVSRPGETTFRMLFPVIGTGAAA
jgi:two-component system sensor histidine kinase KdpD